MKTGMSPLALLYSQPVFVLCVIMYLLAVADAISVCKARLAIDKWHGLV